MAAKEASRPPAKEQKFHGNSLPCCGFPPTAPSQHVLIDTPKRGEPVIEPIDLSRGVSLQDSRATSGSWSFLALFLIRAMRRAATRNVRLGG